jgi:hypothetical protein
MEKARLRLEESMKKLNNTAADLLRIHHHQ